MKVMPAIDIKDGKVVRLTQGDANKMTVYSEDPVGMAKKWASYGVSLIHVVDLDGAIDGNLKNLGIVKKMAESVKCKIELGGGIRDLAAVESVLAANVDRVCIGTRALDPKFLEFVGKRFKNKIVVSIDAKEGLVYSKGWIHKTKITAIELAKKAEDMGFSTVNYTDISKDGMLQGPNINSLKELLRSVSLDIVAAGGVSSIEDVKALKSLEEYGLRGVIIGKALYENKLDLAEAIKICEG